MDIRTIRRMSYEEYSQYLQKFLDENSDTIIEAVSIEGGHAAAFHSNLLDSKMIVSNRRRSKCLH